MVTEDFTITEKAPTRLVLTSSRFQPGEGRAFSVITNLLVDLRLLLYSLNPFSEAQQPSTLSLSPCCSFQRGRLRPRGGQRRRGAQRVARMSGTSKYFSDLRKNIFT